jgi:hypothetical protein
MRQREHSMQWPREKKGRNGGKKRGRAYSEEGSHPAAELDLERRIVLESLLLLERRIEGRHRHGRTSRLCWSFFFVLFLVAPFARDVGFGEEGGGVKVRVWLIERREGKKSTREKQPPPLPRTKIEGRRGGGTVAAQGEKDREGKRWRGTDLRALEEEIGSHRSRLLFSRSVVVLSG